MITTEEGLKSIKICAQCKHYEFVEDGEGPLRHLCRVNKNKFFVDLVTGDRRPYADPLNATDQRTHRSAVCGEKGRNWEPIP